VTRPLVIAEHLHKEYCQGDATLTVLDDVSVTIAPGELVLIMGPSGSGKTTLISILAGLLRPTDGTVNLCGHRITEMSSGKTARVRRRHLGFVFQSYNLFDALSALDNVAEPLTMKGLSLRRARARAETCLAEVGLAHRLHHRPSDLSGGEKQRVAIARAVAGEPNIVFGDEPTAALDGTTAATILGHLRAAVDGGRSVVLVTHDRRLEAYADRIIRLRDGRRWDGDEPPPPSFDAASSTRDGTTLETRA
jgi:putative ABC transport system ATP-binding protein